MEAQDSGASKLNLLVQNACAALQDHRGTAISELDKAFEEHSKWLLQAFKESRKRLRMDEMATANSPEESPKSRVRKEKGVLSERDPNVSFEPSPDTAKGKSPKAASAVKRSSPRTSPAASSSSAEASPDAAADQYQEAMDNAKAFCEDLKFRDLQKEIKTRGQSCKGATKELRERLYSLMVEEILLKQPAAATAVPAKENAAPQAVPEAAAPPEASRVLSPMHTAAGPNAGAIESQEPPASAAKSKSNVFGKLLSGGKKFLKSKRTPLKSATKPAAKASAAKSATRLRSGSPSGSSPSSAGSSDAAAAKPPSPTPFSIAAATDDEPAVEPKKAEEREDLVAAPAELPGPEPALETAGESPAVEKRAEEKEEVLEDQAQMEEDHAQEEEAPTQPQMAPVATATAPAERAAPPSPEAPASPNMMESSMMESPQKPTLDSVVRMSTAPFTAADILAAAQSAHREPAAAASPAHDDMEMSVMMSSPVAAAAPLPPARAPSPVAKAFVAKAPVAAAPVAPAAKPPAPAPPVVHAAPKLVSSAQQQQQAVAAAAAAAVAAKPKPSSALAFAGPGLVNTGGAAAADKKVPAGMSTKPSSHALKLEQIREKQRLATLQKEKEIAEKRAEREKRIQEQKEKAMSEKLVQKQALKTSAEASRDEASAKAAAPVAAPKPAAAAAVSSSSAPAAKPAAPTAKPSALSSIERSAEEEAQRLAAQSAAAQAAADEYDSYCMSEPEEQEDDHSDDDAQRGKAAKRVPGWASKESLRAALKQQCELKIDPDGIFFECNTCNLEEIFERTSKRYQKRTSSANWTDDKSSIYEKLVYKRSVGMQDA